MKNILKIVLLILTVFIASCSSWSENIKNQTWTLSNSWKIEKSTWTVEINWEENNTWKLAVESEITKDFEKTTKLKITKNSKWETCVFDECIHKNVNLTEKDWILRGTSKVNEKGEEVTLEYTIDLKNNSLKKRYTSNTRDYILTFSVFDNNYLAKNIIENDPKKSVVEQTIYDFWLKQADYMPSNIKSFKIWNIEYFPKLVFKNLAISAENKQNYTFTNQWISFKNSEEIIKNIEDNLKDYLFLSEKYLLRFEKYPDLYVLFEAKNFWEFPEQTTYLSKNLKIDEKWNLLDLQITKDILATIGEKDIIEKSTNKRLIDAEEKNLPVFFVKKIEGIEKDWKNLYMIYLIKDKYELKNL